MNIVSVTESARGCGSRACQASDAKPYRMYLALDGAWEACGRLPFPLLSCPTCGGGIHPTMKGTYQWINPTEVIGGAHPLAQWIHETACDLTGDVELADKLEAATIERAGHIPCETPNMCKGCRMSPRVPVSKALLVWIGASHYPDRFSFMREALERGISRRLASLPRGYVPGQTWVYFAHPKGLNPWEPGWVEPDDPEAKTEPQPAIITAGQPRLEVVLPTTDPDEVDDYVHLLAERYEEGDEIRFLHVTPEQVVQGEICE